MIDLGWKRLRVVLHASLWVQVGLEVLGEARKGFVSGESLQDVAPTPDLGGGGLEFNGSE